MRKFIPFCMVLLLTAGCVTSTMRTYPARPGEKSPSGALVVERIDLMNSGMFLFYWLPLWSGAEHRPNRREYRSFEDRINAKYIYRAFDAQCEKGQKVEATQIRFRSSGWWSLGILWKRMVFGSALIVEDTDSRTEAKKSDAPKK